MKPKIIRDTREQKGWEFLENEFFAGTVVKKLDTGDYSIEGYESLLTIERKGCVAELVSWFFESRCQDNLDRLSIFKYKFLLLEFDVDDVINYPNGVAAPKYLKSKMKTSPSYILKRLNEMVVEYEVPYIFVGNHGQKIAEVGRAHV